MLISLFALLVKKDIREWFRGVFTPLGRMKVKVLRLLNEESNDEDCLFLEKDLKDILVRKGGSTLLFNKAIRYLFNEEKINVVKKFYRIDGKFKPEYFERFCGLKTKLCDEAVKEVEEWNEDVRRGYSGFGLYLTNSRLRD